MVNDDTKVWIRWLVARGLPPGHIARTLDVLPGDVAEVLGWKPHGNRKPPRRPDQGKVANQRALKARRLRDLGYSAGDVAELLAVDAGDVADFFRRLTRKQPPHRRARSDTTLNRPRTRREQESLSPWPLNRVIDAGDVAEPGVPAPSETHDLAGLEAAPAPIVPAICDPRGEWSHHQEIFRGRCKLDWDQAQEIRSRRAAGESRPDLARRFGVSVGTIDSVIKRRTYRVRPPAEVTPPPIASAQPSCPATKPRGWREPRGLARLDPRYRDD